MPVSGRAPTHGTRLAQEGHTQFGLFCYGYQGLSSYEISSSRRGRQIRQEIAEMLLSYRERHGVSYFGVLQPHMTDFAKVISLLR